jgi:hypothetical protein
MEAISRCSENQWFWNSYFRGAQMAPLLGFRAFVFGGFSEHSRGARITRRADRSATGNAQPRIHGG